MHYRIHHIAFPSFYNVVVDKNIFSKSSYTKYVCSNWKCKVCLPMSSKCITRTIGYCKTVMLLIIYSILSKDKNKKWGNVTRHYFITANLKILNTINKWSAFQNGFTHCLTLLRIRFSSIDLFVFGWNVGINQVTSKFCQYSIYNFVIHNKTSRWVGFPVLSWWKNCIYKKLKRINFPILD